MSGGDELPPQSIEESPDLRYAARALALAGRALDPNAPDGPSLELGQLLLREAFLAGTRALCNDKSIDAVEAATDALGRRGRPASAAVAALGRTTVADRDALALAESEVTQLVDLARGKPRAAGARWRALLPFGLLAVLAALIAAVAWPAGSKPWEDYTWRVSSAWEGFPQSGTLAHRDRYNLLFHTKEEDDPWIVVDFRTTSVVHDVHVVNRTDCCQDRGLPLVLELAGEEGAFTTVDTRREPFDVWRVTFPPRKARYLRLRAIGRTILHLSEIQIQ